MKKYSFILAACLFMLFSCDLYESPVSSIDKKAIFSTAEGLEAYSISFYNALPLADDFCLVDQTLTDFGCPRNVPSFIVNGSFSENNSGGWSWSQLRNINYFIVNCVDPAVPENVRNNYIGIARFFRAWFYYDKVKTFGDVPWIDRPLEPDDEDLFALRDSRELVMEKIYEDLQFACAHITRTSDATCSLVTRWVAYAFMSRVSLFEGTFRKYHSLNLTTSAATWLKRAEDAATYVMTNSGKSLNSNYRELFTSDVPPTNETLMALCSSATLGVYHSCNRNWTTATGNSVTNLIRPFVCTYLQKNGTPYTDRPGWQFEDLYEECQDRDSRLAASIRTPGYMREGRIALPDFGNYARIGYHPMKLCVDATFGDNAQSRNTQAMQLFRYAEVLLNYAEAKAEQGTLTDADWEKTIGALRQRAGITGGLTAKPTVVDTYLQTTFFPDIADPVILEVRRERGVELLLEGFRFDDLRRWKRGELLKMRWQGIYIPAINQALDVDKNGSYDVIFYTSAAELQNAQSAIGAAAAANCVNVPVTTDLSSTSNILAMAAGDGTGYYLVWDIASESRRVWGNKQYFYPLPILVLTRNPNLTQNPGWENGATNDGK